jgi:peptidoglycan/LPS O-acetylase OafA/YrhL
VLALACMVCSVAAAYPFYRIFEEPFISSRAVRRSDSRPRSAPLLVTASVNPAVAGN